MNFDERIIKDIMILIDEGTNYYELMSQIEKLHSKINAGMFKSHYRQAIINLKNNVEIDITEKDIERVRKKIVNYPTQKPKITEEFIEKIIEYYNAGYSYDDMIKMLGKSSGTITYTVSRLIKEGILKRRKQLRKAREIKVEKINYSFDKLVEYGAIKRWDGTALTDVSYDKYTEKYIEKLLELYMKGIAINVIASVVGRSRNNIHNDIKKLIELDIIDKR